jgi:hypothetical protein
VSASAHVIFGLEASGLGRPDESSRDDALEDGRFLAPSRSLLVLLGGLVVGLLPTRGGGR